jgi:transposase-like protein
MITRLLTVWQEEYQTWRKRSLQGKDYVYIWADGVYFNVRLEEDRLACLVIIGVLPDGRKEVIAIEDGYREFTESWASILRFGALASAWYTGGRGTPSSEGANCSRSSL